MKNNPLFQFNQFTAEKLKQLTFIREGEIKIGETCNIEYQHSDCKYVILGIKEDIGPQSNFGFAGATNAFDAFLTRFLNVQDNRFLNGKDICILGEVIANEEFSNIESGRKSIEELDTFLYSILTPILKLGKIPIVIGGGHNNAYPLIWSSASNLNRAINVINLDPHADCRALEGRHSGNPFSYAKKNQYMNHYSVLGLHQQYNNEAMLNYLDEHKFDYTFFEDYIFNQQSLLIDINSFISKSKTEGIGIELDLDSIAFMPSSAFTPSGFSIEQARNYIHSIAKHPNVQYLHLPEGAPMNSSEVKIVGKTLSYLVTDFIKSNSIN